MSTADLSIATPSPPIDTTGVRSLRDGLIQTSIRPFVARWMIQLFLAAIASLPLLQAGENLLHSHHIQALDVARPPARAAVLLAHGHLRDAAHQVKWSLSKPFLSDFEDQLNANSSAKRLVQPYLQYLLTDWLSFGNSIALIARDGWKPNGWLFYQISLDYLAGPGFLDPHALHHRTQQFIDDGEPHPSADPRPAIIRFSEDCRRAGAHLVFVPIPVKCMLQPAELSPSSFEHWSFIGHSDLVIGHSSSASPFRPFIPSMPTPNNPSYPQFLADLRAAGVDVFDPTPPTLTANAEPYFLMQDTHWTPQWMEQVAQDLVDHIHHQIPLPPPPNRPHYEIVPQLVSRVGDIVDALHLPPHQGLYTPQPVLIHRVLSAATGHPAQSNSHADVLLIGDSFSNIYSAPEMGWGDAAGFPHQLMRFLGRDIEILARNGAAASDLRADLASRAHPLGGKRLVIWQVSMHELTASNWALIPLPQLAIDNSQLPIVNQAPLASSAVPSPHKEQRTMDQGQRTKDSSGDHP